MRPVSSAFLACLLVAVFLLPASACRSDVAYLEPVTDSMFTPGQVWRYHTRSGEEGSMLIVGAVDRAPKVGRVVHVKLVNVSIKIPGGNANVLTHLPVHEDALRRSVTEQVEASSVALEGFQGGYDNWLDAYEGGNVHVYLESVAEALDEIEEAQN